MASGGLAPVLGSGLEQSYTVKCCKRDEKVMVFGGLALVLESGFQQSYTVTVLQACSKSDGFWWSGTCFGIGFSAKLSSYSAASVFKK